MAHQPLTREQTRPAALPPAREAGARPSVARRFLEKRWAVAGLVVLGILLLLALFAPLLANNRPLLFQDDDGWSSPALAALNRNDFLWFAGGTVVVFHWLTGALLRRRSREGTDRGAAHSVRCLAVAGLICAAALIAVLWPERLDRSDYRAYRSGEKTALTCVWAPVPYSPLELSLIDKISPPDGEHWLGTDAVGRDLLARLIYGTRVSLLVGFVAVALYVLIGVAVGALAGYFGGWIDLLLSRFIEVVICFPTFFAILAVLCFLPPGILWIMLLIGLLRWPGVARLTRGEFLRLKNEEFVLAGRALGLSHFRVICFQILPNSLGPVMVAATFGMAGAILLESGLSFLGFGVQPPVPSWGEMLSAGRQHFERSWWLTFFPGLAIFAAVTSFNLVGEGLRDALDPKTNNGPSR